MRSIVAASIIGVAGARMQCPGSPAWFTHAGLRMSNTADVSCDVVEAEIRARIAGENGWYDQHNRGSYTVQNYGGDVSASRVTGDGKYTDKIIFTLTEERGSCLIESCSESQVTSVADYGTNYCEQKLLICGSAEGCNVAHSDFTLSDEQTRTMAGATTGMDNCLLVKEEAKEEVKQPVEVAVEGYKCPGSASFTHAWIEVTSTADASCSQVHDEIVGRASSSSWVDPHNGGIYSVLDDSQNVIQTQRTTNPATSVGGQVYVDKQTFELIPVSGGCKIKGCSESQGNSVGDFSTNYCDLRNLWCGSADGCQTAVNPFTVVENTHHKSIGAGHDFSGCVVRSAMEV